MIIEATPSMYVKDQSLSGEVEKVYEAWMGS